MRISTANRIKLQRANETQPSEERVQLLRDLIDAARFAWCFLFSIRCDECVTRQVA